MKNRILFIIGLICIPTLGFSQITTEKSLQTLLVKKRAYNQQSKQGFCIQLYNGNEKTALKRMQDFKELFPEIEIKRIYKVPEWKVQTISYKTRIEADRVLNKIKEEYPGARVL
ncbi:MAG: hypothetical protein P8L42_06735 [Flavicella sp.]|nr:hypothetical protein [Flavicella sp.]